MSSLRTGKRLARDIFKETGVMIQSYNNVFEQFLQQVRDGGVRDVVVAL